MKSKSQESTQTPAQGQISRRRFLKLGIGTGAAVLTCAGVGTFAAAAPPVSYPESEGSSAASKRVLVTYATYRGSTGEIAQAVAQTLAGRGFRVDLHPISHVTDLSGYAAVLVGSAIRMRKWLPEAVSFVKNHRDSLSQIPTSYFTACLTLADDTEENRRKASAFLNPVRQILTPVQEGWFAGCFDSNKSAAWEGMLGQVMGMRQGDFRNWEAIRAWAGQVPV